jgi:hypothetical protein
VVTTRGVDKRLAAIGARTIARSSVSPLDAIEAFGRGCGATSFCALGARLTNAATLGATCGAIQGTRPGRDDLRADGGLER